MTIDFFITLFLGGGAFFILVWGAIILWKYSDKTIQNRILMLSIILWIAFAVWYIASVYYSKAVTDKILSVKHLAWGIITGFATMAYPVLVLCTVWLRKKILLLFFGTTAFLFIVYITYWALTGKGLEEYRSLSELAGHWTDFSVILRLVIFAVSVLYNLVVIWLIFRILPIYEAYVKNTYSDLEYNLRWLRVVGSFYIGITAVYSLNIFCFSWWARLIYIAVDFPLWLILLNQAIFHKTFSPAKDFEIAWSWRKGWYEDYREREDAVASLAVDVLIRRMERYMRTSEPYSNFNLTREDFAKAVSSNRTTLAQAIRQLGYDSFQDYIGRHRIERFKQLAKENPEQTITALSKMSGFSSRSTFYSYFKQVEGMLPAEYIERNNESIV